MKLTFYHFLILPMSLLFLASYSTLLSAQRPSLWVNVYSGEPVRFPDLITDLEKVDVIYLGERHVIKRHHDLHKQIIEALHHKKISLVVGLEQLESWQQPILDKFNSGQTDFDQLAQETNWEKIWSNYKQYQEVIETAHQLGAKLIALNARYQTVRKVSQSGIDQLDETTRKSLPADMLLEDPPYRAFLDQLMMVHASVDESRLERIFQAQVVRDEVMAAQIVKALQNNPSHKVVVLCGVGHVNYGMGIPTRVRRSLPNVQDRILVFSESGDVKLSAAEKKASREISITHDDLRKIQTPIADYLHVISFAD